MEQQPQPPEPPYVAPSAVIASPSSIAQTSAPAHSTQATQNAPAHAPTALDAAAEPTPEPSTTSSAPPPHIPPPPPPPSRSLLDLPWPWLRLLMGCLDSKELVVMLGTCKALHTLILPGRHVTLTKAISHPHAATQHHSLVAACQHAAQVHLKLSGVGPAADPGQQQPDQASAAAFLHTTVADLGHTLDKVTHATLKALSLDCLVPVWLTDTCPQLTSLCLEDVTLTLPATPAHPPPSTTLKHLTLPAPSLLAADAHAAAATAQLLTAYRQHLEALPSLQQLTITTEVSEQFLTQVIATPLLQQRLTAVHLLVQWQAEPVAAMLSNPASWPKLTDLSLPNFNAIPELLVQFLAIPSLTSLSCVDVWPHENYSQHTCQWQHLALSGFRFQALARLPLNRLQTITICKMPQPANLVGKYVIVPSPQSQDNDRVLAELQRMGGLRWSRQPPEAQQGNDFPQAAISDPGTPTDAQVIFLPGNNWLGGTPGLFGQLLSSYQPLTRCTLISVNGRLTPAVVEQLATMPQPRPGNVKHRWMLELPVDWVANPPAADVLSRLLPSCSGFNAVVLQGAVTEAQVAALCDPTPRPRGGVCFLLNRWEHLQPGRDGRVKAATRAVKADEWKKKASEVVRQMDPKDCEQFDQVMMALVDVMESYAGRPEWEVIDSGMDDVAGFMLKYGEAEAEESS